MSKMKIDIPGWGSVDFKNIVIDLNGTIATDGRITLEIKEKINSLSNQAKIYILTADTQGTAHEEAAAMNVELIKISEEDSKREIRFLRDPRPRNDSRHRKWEQRSTRPERGRPRHSSSGG